MDKGKKRLLVLIITLVLVAGPVLFMTVKRVRAGAYGQMAGSQTFSGTVEGDGGISSRPEKASQSGEDASEDDLPGAQLKEYSSEICEEETYDIETAQENVLPEKKEAPSDFDPFDYGTVFFYGDDGEGVARCALGQDPYGMLEFADFCVEPSTGLSNGDHVVFQIMYYPDYLFKIVKKEYVVEGLKEPKEK